jgi:hypothetical protein
MNKGKFKKMLTAAAATAIIAGGLALTGVTAASAATVPNRYACDIDTGKCYQINGAYNPSVSRQCHWRYGGTAGKPNTITVSSCNSWGSPLWISV